MTAWCFCFRVVQQTRVHPRGIQRTIGIGDQGIELRQGDQCDLRKTARPGAFHDVIEIVQRLLDLAVCSQGQSDVPPALRFIRGQIQDLV